MSNTSEQTLAELLLELEQSQFYGSLELKFEAGRVVLMRKTETIKLPFENNRDKRGKHNSR